MAGEGGVDVFNIFEQVTGFINSQNDPDFIGATWMLLANWYNVHPDPHGDSAEQDRQDPYLQSVSDKQNRLYDAMQLYRRKTIKYIATYASFVYCKLYLALLFLCHRC